MTNLEVDKSRVNNIIQSLYEAGSGTNVYYALCALPTENLEHMLDMIENILENREDV